MPLDALVVNPRHLDHTFGEDVEPSPWVALLENRFVRLELAHVAEIHQQLRGGRRDRGTPGAGEGNGGGVEGDGEGRREGAKETGGKRNAEGQPGEKQAETKYLSELG